MLQLRKNLLGGLVALFLALSFSSQAWAFTTLHPGSKGDKVVEVQAMLSELQLYKLAVDGEYGSATEKAVKSFQKKKRKAQSGRVDSALYRLLAKESKLDFSKAKKKLKLHATAYSSQDRGVGKFTCTGERLHKGLVAVDPRYIPLGTRMYITGYGWGKAADIGGAIKGHKIDLAYNTHREAISFGRRNVVAYIF